VSSESDDEVENQKAIGKFILEQVPADAIWILGPGTTVKEVAELVGVKKTFWASISAAMERQFLTWTKRQFCGK
jgi:DeoR/GlpR family transcriptional regulator of sugar metabolism